MLAAGANNGNVVESVAYDAVSVSRGYAYGYDAVGNMTSNNGVVQAYDADNQITAAGALTYTFDPNGNQTGASQSTLQSWRYDAQNYTIGYNDSLSSATFTVDGGMQRRAKTTTTGGTTTSGVFDGDLYRQTSPVSRTIYYVRDPSGRLLALTDGTTVYYYGLDGHGSVSNLIDKNGAVVNTYRYDPYGNSLGKTEGASIPNPWQYAGGYFDAESGLYLLGARYYTRSWGVSRARASTRSRRTRCATRSPRTSSTTASTCARCRSCWATLVSPRHIQYRHDADLHTRHRSERARRA